MFLTCRPNVNNGSKPKIFVSDSIDAGANIKGPWILSSLTLKCYTVEICRQGFSAPSMLVFNKVLIFRHWNIVYWIPVEPNIGLSISLFIKSKTFIVRNKNPSWENYFVICQVHFDYSSFYGDDESGTRTSLMNMQW